MGPRTLLDLPNHGERNGTCDEALSALVLFNIDGDRVKSASGELIWMMSG